MSLRQSAQPSTQQSSNRQLGQAGLPDLIREGIHFLQQTHDPIQEGIHSPEQTAGPIREETPFPEPAPGIATVPEKAHFQESLLNLSHTVTWQQAVGDYLGQIRGRTLPICHDPALGSTWRAYREAIRLLVIFLDWSSVLDWSPNYQTNHSQQFLH